MTDLDIEDLKVYSDKRFQITKTGMVGAQRDTMLSNELQFLPQLGKSRTRGHQLPPNEFIYGVANQKLDGGVAEGKFISTFLHMSTQLISNLKQTLFHDYSD